MVCNLFCLVIYFGYNVVLCELHHAAHATLAHRHCGSLFLRLVANETLSGEEHTCNRGSILKSYALYLSRIDNSSLTQILVNILACIVAEVAFALANLLNNNGTFATCILNNLTKRLLNSTTYDVDTSLLVGIVTLKVLKSLLSADVSCTATYNNAFFHSCTCSAESVVNAVLLLLHLNLAVGTNIQNCYATCELCQTLLKLLLVV